MRGDTVLYVSAPDIKASIEYDLDKEKDQRDYGTLIHSIIEDFNNRYPEQLPPEPLDVLVDLGRQHFSSADLSKDLEAFWWPKFLKTAEWIIAQEKEYRFLRLTSLFAIGIPTVIGFLAAIDFNKAFVIFHQIVFFRSF